MRKVIVKIKNQYPFKYQNSNSIYVQTNVIVKQVKKVSDYDHSLAKVRFAKNLKNKHLIKLKSFDEEFPCINIFYEHVFCKTNIMSQALTPIIYEQMQALSKYLTNIGLRVGLQIQRIGLDSFSTVKYFMGVDFEWDENQDEEYLPSFYEQQLKKIFGNFKPFHLEKKLIPLNHSNQMSTQHAHTNRIAERKTSTATLPERFNRLFHIDKQLSNLKNFFGDSKFNISEKQFSPASDNKLRKIQSAKNSSHKNKQHVTKYSEKKILDRKYSGDTNLQFFSSKKIYQKQSENKSERGLQFTTKTKINKRKLKQNWKEEVQSIKSKSRVEQMKEKEYQQITNTNKSYLEEFMSVLEHGQEMKRTSLQTRDQSPFSTPPTNGQFLGRSIQLFTKNENNYNNAALLQQKARDAITNSMKAIRRFKVSTQVLD